MDNQWKLFSDGKIKIVEIAYHRNGICGNGFHVVNFLAKFKGNGNSQSNMVAILFEESGSCAVLDVDLLAKGDAKFGSNSWRGDHFRYNKIIIL